MHLLQREGEREPRHLETRKTIGDAIFYPRNMLSMRAVNALNVWYTFTD